MDVVPENSKMRFDVLTLFPESINNFLNESIIGRKARRE